MTLRDRIGVDVGRRLKLEDALVWAARHDVRHIDIELDTDATALTELDEALARQSAPPAPSTASISASIRCRR